METIDSKALHVNQSHQGMISVTPKIILFFLLCFMVNCCAQDASRVRIQASSGPVQLKKSKPTPEELAGARLEAQRAVIRAYFTKVPEDRQKLLLPYQDQFLKRVDSYVSDVEIVAELVDSKTKILNVSVVGFVDEANLNAVLPKESGAKNYISMVFVSRRQTSVKTLGPEAVTATFEVSAVQQIRSQEGTGGTDDVKVVDKKDQAVVTKSAVTTSSEKRIYEVATADSLNSAIEGVLATRNFRVVPSATIRKRSNGAFAVEKFVESFKIGNDISEELVEAVAEACKGMKPQLPFYGYGTLTLEPPRKNPVSGRTEVNVQIYAKIIDCRGDFPETAASLAGIQLSGDGESATEAETVALTGAAKETAKLLADKLNAKGIF